MNVSEDVTGALRAQEHGHQPIVFEPGAASRVGGHVYEDGIAGTVRANAGDNQQAIVYGISSYNSNAMKSDNPNSGIYEAETARTLDLNGGNPACNQGGMAVCVGNGQLAQAKLSEKVGALNCMHDQQALLINTKGNDNAGTQSQILRLLQETYGEETILKWGVAVLDTLQQAEILRQGVHEGGIQSKTQNRQKLDDGSLPCSEFVANWLLRDMRKREKCGCTPQGQKSAEQRFEQFDESMPELSQQNPQTCKDLFNMWEKGERLGLLRQALSEIQEVWQSFDGKGQSVHGCSIVRRLTPLEAERLQGYPDGWTDIGEWVDSKGKKHKDADSPRYKALGNSIALPFWEWMAKRMVKQIDHTPTMASLFDGIGGFPLVFLRAGCEPIWASEIEEFPIAVTKKRFSDDYEEE